MPPPVFCTYLVTTYCLIYSKTASPLFLVGNCGCIFYLSLLLDLLTRGFWVDPWPLKMNQWVLGWVKGIGNLLTGY
ncbi:uncharacterized protein BJX67DRAFT_362680 [Aspergillus lucknowensis]|uniref:Uncharacterized protein n=1 Tax=Aspergillus lucknowensis TaxID=176173 RepID=A0ABR4LH33_9EURO